MGFLIGVNDQHYSVLYIWTCVFQVFFKGNILVPVRNWKKKKKLNQNRKLMVEKMDKKEHLELEVLQSSEEFWFPVRAEPRRKLRNTSKKWHGRAV